MNPHDQPVAKPADHPDVRRLVLCCGNTLRGDDGVGWQIAAQLELSPSLAEVQIIVTQQLLPEHAELLSESDLAVVIDCSALAGAGQVSSIPIEPADHLPRILTHHLDPASLLRLALDLYGKIPSRTTAITVGGESFDLMEKLSDSVGAAIPAAIEAVLQALR
jgi:hydrogenase maturation protease